MRFCPILGHLHKLNADAHESMTAMHLDPRMHDLPAGTRQRVAALCAPVGWSVDGPTPRERSYVQDNRRRRTGADRETRTM